MPYYDDILEFEPNLDGTELRIGIVMSRFNIDVGKVCSVPVPQSLRKMVCKIRTYCL